MIKKKRSDHRKALEILSEHPEYIGINKREVITTSIEQKLFYRGNFYVELDLVYELKNQRAIIVEYKSNGNKLLIKKGQSQLEKAVDFYQKIKKYTAEGRLITGDSHPILRKRKSNNSATKSNLRNTYTNRPSNLRKKRLTV